MLTEPILLALFAYTSSVVASPLNPRTGVLGIGDSCTNNEPNAICQVTSLGINGVCLKLGVSQELRVDLLARDID